MNQPRIRRWDPLISGGNHTVPGRARVQNILSGSSKATQILSLDFQVMKGRRHVIFLEKCLQLRMIFSSQIHRTSQDVAASAELRLKFSWAFSPVLPYWRWISLNRDSTSIHSHSRQLVFRFTLVCLMFEFENFASIHKKRT